MPSQQTTSETASAPSQVATNSTRALEAGTGCHRPLSEALAVLNTFLHCNVQIFSWRCTKTCHLSLKIQFRSTKRASDLSATVVTAPKSHQGEGLTE
eukprot:3444386-Rhodomonas_salina.1